MTLQQRLLGIRRRVQPRFLYDNNTDNCLRTKDSYGPQMEADTTRTGSSSSSLRDAAWSGSRLVELAKVNHQTGKVGEPDVVIMTPGGNSCDIGAIVDVCIYHSSPTTNYGLAYADDIDGKTTIPGATTRHGMLWGYLPVPISAPNCE